MFRLDNKINSWQKELISNQSMDESDAGELVSHLKDNIEELVAKGLTEEESFWVAKHRLGDTQALSVEFAKVNAALIWRKRILLLLLGYFLFSTFPSVVNLVATIPAHLLDMPWLFTGIPLLPPEYSAPFMIFIFILTVSGTILFLLMSKENILSKVDRFKFISWLKKGNKLFIGSFSSYLVLYLISIFWPYFIVRIYESTTVIPIYISVHMFEIVWNVFLFSVLFITSILVFKRKKEQIAA